MKKELDYIQVDDALGGNQDWFWDPFMKGGGCAAVTACDVCIYLQDKRGIGCILTMQSILPGKTISGFPSG